MSWLLTVLCIGGASWALLDSIVNFHSQFMDSLLGEQTKITPTHQVYVYVRNDKDLNYFKEIEVTRNLGTSNYIRFLDGLISRTDGNRGYWVDHFDADQEHHYMKFGD